MRDNIYLNISLFTPCCSALFVTVSPPLFLLTATACNYLLKPLTLQLPRDDLTREQHCCRLRAGRAQGVGGYKCNLCLIAAG